MPKLNMEEVMRKMEQDKAEHFARVVAFGDQDPMDDEGYPTDEALVLIEKWHWTDRKAFMDFVHKCWYMASWGWREEDKPHEYRDNQMVTQYNISTAGWSGNEAVISSMQKSDFLWHCIWVQSRRGGHYIFEIEHETETD